MCDITDKIKKFVDNTKDLKSLTYSNVSSAVGCSADQVRRRAGNYIKLRKGALKKEVKNKPGTSKSSQAENKPEIDNSLLLKILSRFDDLEGQINQVKKQVKQLSNDNWIDNDGSYYRNKFYKVKYGDGTVKSCMGGEVSFQTFDNALDREISSEDNRASIKAEELAEKEVYKVIGGTYPELDGVDGLYRCDCERRGDHSCDNGEIACIKNERFIDYRKLFKRTYNELYNKFYDAEFTPRDMSNNNYITHYQIIDESNKKIMDKLDNIQSSLNKDDNNDSSQRYW